MFHQNTKIGWGGWGTMNQVGQMKSGDIYVFKLLAKCTIYDKKLPFLFHLNPVGL